MHRLGARPTGAPAAPGRPVPAGMRWVACALLVMAGCAVPPEPSPTAESTSRPPPSTSRETTAPSPTSVRGARLTAEQVVTEIKASGQPILGYTIHTAETDPERLLGRPGQYTSKVTFSDRRLARGGGSEAATVDAGGAVEVFAAPAHAARRAQRLAAAPRPPFLFRRGPVLVQVSPQLGRKAAVGYDAALARVVAASG